jgi:hypothetical protein
MSLTRIGDIHRAQLLYTCSDAAKGGYPARMGSPVRSTPTQLFLLDLLHCCMGTGSGEHHNSLHVGVWLCSTGQDLGSVYTWNMYRPQGALHRLRRPQRCYRPFDSLSPTDHYLEIEAADPAENWNLGNIWSRDFVRYISSCVSATRLSRAILTRFRFRTCACSGFRLKASINYYTAVDKTYTSSVVTLCGVGETACAILMYCLPTMPVTLRRLGDKSAFSLVTSRTINSVHKLRDPSFPGSPGQVTSPMRYGGLGGIRNTILVQQNTTDTQRSSRGLR